MQRQAFSLSYDEPEPKKLQVDVPEGTLTALNSTMFCGDGLELQGNVQLTTNPTFELLVAPKEGERGYDPKLTKLAKQVNDHFQPLASQTILARRAETTIGCLELTVRIKSHGFELAYAVPKEGRRKAPEPQWVLGGRFWLWLSRVVYRLTHVRARIPTSVVNNPSTAHVKGRWNWLWIPWTVGLAGVAAWLLFFNDGAGGITSFHLPWDQAAK